MSFDKYFEKIKFKSTLNDSYGNIVSFALDKYV